MGIRFRHTADLQIGKGLGQFPLDVAAALRAERLDTLKRFALLARDLAVDAVLVAGDCFDDIAVADETLRRFKVAHSSQLDAVSLSPFSMGTVHPDVGGESQAPITSSPCGSNRAGKRGTSEPSIRHP